MPTQALNRWLLVQAVLWTTILVLIAWSTADGVFRAWTYWPLAALFLASFAWLWRLLGCGGSAADRATLARLLGLVLVCVLLGRTGAVTWGLWFALLAVVLGDLVDGWLARRFGGSEAGAVLDMETDQLVLLLLAVLALASGAGAWPLLVPAVRYVFVLAMRALGVPHHEPKPIDGDNRRGRLVCALVTVLLLACSLPPLPEGARVALGLVAALALAASYGGDVSFLLRRSRAASS